MVRDRLHGGLPRVPLLRGTERSEETGGVEVTPFYDESPRIVFPSQAAVFGTEGALVLQQIRWAILHDDRLVVEEDGELWIAATVGDLRERWFDFIPQRSLERIISEAKASGVLITKRKRNGALYRVDVENRQIGGSTTATLAEPRVKGEVKEEEEHPADPDTLFAGEIQEESVPDGPDLPQVIWDRWEETFPGRTRLGLTPSRRTQLKKALKAVDGNVDICLRAIVGFASWLSAHPEKNQSADISRVFATNIHDKKNLTDKIIGWADDAPTGATTAIYLSDYDRREITHHKAMVSEMYARNVQDDESSPYRIQGHQALAWLKDKYGIEHDAEPDGRIVWTDPTKKPGGQDVAAQ